MLNKPSALRMASRIFFATFFSLSVTAQEAPSGAPLPEAPAADSAVSDGTAPETAVVPTGKVIYKSIDSSGKVTFTDSAPVGRPSEAINVPVANTLPSVPGDGGVGASEEKQNSVKYTQLTVTSPANDEVLGQDVASVTLAAQLEPGLQKGHTFQFYYDGNPVGDGGMSYTVGELVRGTHTVEAKVFDSKKKLVKSSGKIQFHVRRISSINRLTATPLPANGSKPVVPPAIPAGGFGSPKGVGGAGGSNAPGAAGSAGDTGSARGANSSRSVTPSVKSK